MTSAKDTFLKDYGRPLTVMPTATVEMTEEEIAAVTDQHAAANADTIRKMAEAFFTKKVPNS